MEDDAAESRWLKCLSCNGRLAPVGAHAGRTAIPLNLLWLTAWVDRAEITCPVCGAVRRFVSVPIRSEARAPRRLA